MAYRDPYNPHPGRALVLAAVLLWGSLVVVAWRGKPDPSLNPSPRATLNTFAPDCITSSSHRPQRVS
jgi:hypothetical protein